VAAAGNAQPAGAPAADAGRQGDTEADRIAQRYKALGEAQKHKFGEGLPGSKPPDFNMVLPAGGPPAQQPEAAPGKKLAAPPAVPPQ
jgi:hypothetical protein